MTACGAPCDLRFLEDQARVARLVEAHLGAPVTGLEKVGKGFYAHVYLATLERGPRAAIVKCQSMPLWAGVRPTSWSCCGGTRSRACPRSMPFTSPPRTRRTKP